MRRPTVLGAPSNLGLKPPAPGREPGTAKAPAALRRAGIVAALAADDAGDVIAPPYVADVESCGIRNAARIGRYSVAVADRLGELLREGILPVVLGGDCSILLGTGLALRRRGRYGLAFLDGHRDLATPAASQTGGAAGMDLALATGIGPRLLSDLEGRQPLFLPDDVVAIAFRDELDHHASASGIDLRPLEELQRGRLGEAGRTIADELGRDTLDGFWIHVDVDVLDSRSMPAVDSPQPGGLTHEELAQLLGPLLASPAAVGVEITIFDPDLDPSGELATQLVGTLAHAFSERASSAENGAGAAPPPLG